MKPGSSRQYFLPIFSNANILKIKIIKRQHIIINSGRFLTKKRKNKKIGKKSTFILWDLILQTTRPQIRLFS